MLNPADHTYTGLITGLPRRSVTTILAEEGYIEKRFYREGFQDIGTQGAPCYILVRKKDLK